MRFPALIALILGLATIAGGCPYMGDRAYERNVQDFDGDGVDGVRFGGDDCRDDDPSILRCDADGDGADAVEVGGTDCDDHDPNVQGRTWWFDGDGDLFGDPAQVSDACDAPAHYVDNDRDCNDSDAGINPGVSEECDDVDRNCDGDDYAGADGQLWYVDADRDAYGSDELGTVASCSPPDGFSQNSDDCDDSDGGVHPGAEEIWYDGIDQDCSGGSDDDRDGDGESATAAGGTDCDDDDPLVGASQPELCDGVDNDCDLLVDDEDDDDDQIGQLVYYLDADRDGSGSPFVSVLFCPGAQSESYVLVGDDCNDGVATIHPGATEVCNGVDDDCNQALDDGAVDAFTVYQDLDGDGWGDAPIDVCGVPVGYVLADGDCDDLDPLTHPGAPELCGDAIRQDCTAFSPFDCDSDGYDALDQGGLDCDDDPVGPGPGIHPGAAEVCDGLDNDCNGLADSADPGVDPTSYTDWFLDLDGDGYGITALVAAQTCDPPPFTANNSLDCDDTNATVNPGELEACDGLDNDCDLAIDEDPQVGIPTFFWDDDGDGDGDPAITFSGSCSAPADEPWVPSGGDCDDANTDRSSLLPELCDGLDDDCDLLVDDADPDVDAPPWYEDADGDGWGLASSVVRACNPPPAYAATPGDCNDQAVNANPGATEVCDAGLDNDCDGFADDADPDLSAGTTWYADADADGYGDPNVVVNQCGQPPSFVANSDDCDDTLASVSPAALEVCDGGIDDDCDGAADDLDTVALGQESWYADSDGDGLGGGAAVAFCDDPGQGYVLLPGDCDDSNPAIGATRWYLDGDGDGVGGTVVQSSCSDPSLPGQVWTELDGDCDDGDPLVGGPAVWFADLDGDGSAGTDQIALSCSPGAGWALSPDDCDDGDAAVHPGAPDVCDARDDDCDGAIDEDPASDPAAESLYPDADGDGHGDAAAAPSPSCSLLAGFSLTNDDCDDGDAFAWPGFPVELCDGADNDCDGLLDDQDSDTTVLGTAFYVDADGDGAGGGAAFELCADPGAGWTRLPTDCDDAAPAVHPGAAERCDGFDDNCDGLVDEDDPGLTDGTDWYPDDDDDGHGGSGAVVTTCGSAPAGGPWAIGFSDCDDADATAYLGAPELCDGIDHDCDGVVMTTAWRWPDVDGDGDGDRYAVPTYECAGVGTSTNDYDCDDADAAVTATVAQVSTGADLETQVSSGGCMIVQLAAGFDDVAAVAFTAGSEVLVMSLDPAARAIVRQKAAGTPVFSADGLTGAVAVEGVDVEGGLGGSLVLVGAGGWLSLSDVDVDGSGVDQGLDIGLGLAVLAGVSIHDVVGTPGSAIELASGSTLAGGEITVTNAPGLGSIDLQILGAAVDIEGLSVTNSGPVNLSAPIGAGTAILSGVDVRSGTSDAIVINGVGATLLLDHAVLADAVGAGLRVKNGVASVIEATITGNDTNGIVIEGSGNAALANGIAWFNGGKDFMLLGGSGSAAHSMVETTQGLLTVVDQVAGPPDFVAFAAGAPSDLLDLHLRDPLVGAPGALGAYDRTDPWYLDLTGNGIPDGWEIGYLGVAGNDPAFDLDRDGLSLAGDYAAGTDPTLLDTDGDGANDAVDSAPLDPLVI